MSSIPPPNGTIFPDEDHGFDVSSLYPLDLFGQNSQQQSRLSQPEAGTHRPPPFPLRDLPWDLQQALTAHHGPLVNTPANDARLMPYQYSRPGDGSRGFSHSPHIQYQGGTQSSLFGSGTTHGQAISSGPAASSSEPSPAPFGTVRDGGNGYIPTEVQQHQVDSAQTHMTHAGQLWIKDTVFRNLAKFLTTMNIEIPLTTPEDDECSICRLGYGRERVGVKTVCGHWFCGACILEWFGMPRHSCPMCRGNLKKPPRRPARERRRGRAA